MVVRSLYLCLNTESNRIRLCRAVLPNTLNQKYPSLYHPKMDSAAGIEPYTEFMEYSQVYLTCIFNLPLSISSLKSIQVRGPVLMRLIGLFPDYSSTELCRVKLKTLGYRIYPFESGLDG